jgi:hypothetical protein
LLALMAFYSPCPESDPQYHQVAAPESGTLCPAAALTAVIMLPSAVAML